MPDPTTQPGPVNRSGRQIKDRETGKVMSEGELLKKGASQKDIDDMLKSGLVQEVTGEDSAAPVKKKGSTSSSDDSSNYSDLSLSVGGETRKPVTSSSSSASEPLQEDPTASGTPVLTDLDSATIKLTSPITTTPDSTKAPKATPETAPKQDPKPGPGFFGWLKNAFTDFAKTSTQGGLLEDAVRQGQEKDPKVEADRLKMLSGRATSQMASDPTTYFHVDRPGPIANLPTDKNPFGTHADAAPDSKYTYVNEKALDNLLKTVTDPSGRMVTMVDRQNMRNQILQNIEQERGMYDAIEAAKRNYRLKPIPASATARDLGTQADNFLVDDSMSPFAGMQDPNKADPIAVAQPKLMPPNSWVKAPDPKAPNAFLAQSKYMTDLMNGTLPPDPEVKDPDVLYDPQGKRTDAPTLAGQSIDQVVKGKGFEQLKDLAKFSYDRLETELEARVKSGSLTPEQATKYAQDYQIKMQGSLEDYITVQVQRLNKQVGIPRVYQAEIDMLEKQLGDNKDPINNPLGEINPTTAMHNQAVTRLRQLKELQASGNYSQEEDANWSQAMKDGYKEMLLRKNEALQDVFNNQGMAGGRLDDNASFRGTRNFLAKQEQGILMGIGNIEAMAGGVLNMMHIYGAGNALTKRGQDYAQANELPMQIDKYGNEVIIDDDLPTWISRNVSAQIPLIASLGGTANISGKAVSGFLEGAGVFKKVSPFMEGAMGGLIEAVPESIMEAADSYNQYIGKGDTVQEANKKAASVFHQNLIMTGLLNPLEYGLMKMPINNKLGSVMHAGLEANLNGGQEIIQNWIQERQGDPTLSLWDYASSPEGMSTGLSGMAVGAAQSTIMGKIEAWQVRSATNRLMDFNNQYMPTEGSGRFDGLPSNQAIATKIFHSFNMRDTYARRDQLLKTVDRLEAAGTYNATEAIRVRRLVDDVDAVRKQVPEYGSNEQQMAVFNELMQIHTNNKYAKKSGTTAIADAIKLENGQIQERINRIMANQEPLYFVQGNQTNPAQLRSAVEKMEKSGILGNPNINISITNDEALQKEIAEKITKAQQEWKAKNPSFFKRAIDKVLPKKGVTAPTGEPSTTEAAPAAATGAATGAASAAAPGAATGSATGSTTEATKPTVLSTESTGTDPAIAAINKERQDKIAAVPAGAGSTAAVDAIDKEYDAKVSAALAAKRAAAPEAPLKTEPPTKPAEKVKPVEPVKTEATTTADYATPDEEETMFGKPEKVFNNKVSQLYDDYNDKSERAGGEEEFNRFGEQVTGLLKNAYEKAGLDRETVTDDIRDQFMGEIYDSTGAGKNGAKTGNAILKSFVADAVKEAKKKGGDRKLDAAGEMAQTIKDISKTAQADLQEYMKEKGLTIEQFGKMSDAEKAKTNQDMRNWVEQKYAPKAKPNSTGSTQETEQKKTEPASTAQQKSTKESTKTTKDLDKKKETMQSRIDALPDDLYYLTHITSDEDAKSINDSQFVYNPGSGINGTFNVGASKNTIKATLLNLLEGRSPHRGQLGMMLMGIPKADLLAYANGGKITADVVEGYLLDNFPEMAAGKIPTQFHVGYFANGEFTGKEAAKESKTESKPAAETKAAEPKSPAPKTKPENQKPADAPGKPATGNSAGVDASNTAAAPAAAKPGRNFDPAKETDPERKKVLEELQKKKEAFRKAGIEARSNTNANFDPIKAAKWIATGIDLMGTYTKLEVNRFGDVARELIDTYGKKFMDSDMVEGLRSAYVAWRAQQPREMRKTLDSDDDIEDFINDELPALVEGDDEDSEQDSDQDPEPDNKADKEAELEAEKKSKREFSHPGIISTNSGEYILQGRNADGDAVYEDKNGRRHVRDENRVMEGEAVQAGNVAGGVKFGPNISRDARFLTEQELSDKSKEPIVRETALEKIADAFKKRFGTNVKVVSREEAARLLQEQGREYFFQILDDVDLFDGKTQQEVRDFLDKVFTTVSTKEEAQKAWRRMALKYHPDRAGSIEIMQDVNNAYDEYKSGYYKGFSRGGGTGAGATDNTRSSRPNQNGYADPYGAAAEWMKRQKAKQEAAEKMRQQAERERAKDFKAKAGERATEAERTQARKEADASISFARERQKQQTERLVKWQKAETAAIQARYQEDLRKMGADPKNAAAFADLQARRNDELANIKEEYDYQMRGINDEFRQTVVDIEDGFAGRFRFQRDGEGTIPAGFYDPATRTAYLVEGIANDTTPIHEIFSHPFIEAIEKVNQPLFARMLETISSNDDVMGFVYENYPGVDPRTFSHEMIARAIDLEARNQLKDKTLIDHIKEFWQSVTDAFKDLFGGKKAAVENLDANTKLSDLVKFILQSGESLNLAVEEAIKPKNPAADKGTSLADFYTDGAQPAKVALKASLSTFSRKLQDALGWEAAVAPKGSKNPGRPVHSDVDMFTLGGNGIITLYKPGTDFGVTITIPFTVAEQNEKEGLQLGSDIEFQLASRADAHLGKPLYTGFLNFNVQDMAEKMSALVDGYDQTTDNGTTTTDSLDTSLLEPDGSTEAELDGTQPAGQDAGTLPGGTTQGLLDAGSGTGGGSTAGANGKGAKTGRSGGRSKRRNSGSDAGSESGSQKPNEGGGTRRNTRQPKRVEPDNINDRNHVIGDEDTLVPKGDVAKIYANVDAILLLQTLEAENRNPTPEEKRILSQFTGWGGVANALKDVEGSGVGERLVKNIINGGMFSFGHGSRQVMIEFEKLDTKGKSFEQIAKQIQSRFNKAIEENRQNLAYYLTDDESNNLPLSDARQYFVLNSLSESEIRAAKESTQSAYYTDRNVIKTMWDAARRLGFDGGNVLEAGAGVGHFVGLMPTDLSGYSNVTGVEKDSYSGRILRKLYPESNMLNKDYGAVNLRPSSQDLVIGNVPFGPTGLVADANNKDIEKFNLHNYFIAKNLRMLKPGGIAIMITSHRTLDASSSIGARRFFNSQEGGNSDLVGAIRLPNNAFEGTEVTSDILIFQKRRGPASEFANEYINTVNLVSEMREDELREIDINEYFKKHPDQLIGEMKFATDAGSGGLNGKYSATAVAPEGLNVFDRVKELFNQLPADIMNTDKADAYTSFTPISTTERDGRMYEQDGELYISEGDQAVPAKINGKPLSVKQAQAARRYLKLRDAQISQLNLEMDPDATDDEIELNRRLLNQEYDDFANNHKSLNHQAWLYDLDMDYSLVRGLEDVVPKVKINEKNGKISRDFDVFKGSMLLKRVMFPRTEPRTAENLNDAINISLAYRNSVNDTYIATLLGITPNEARQQLIDDKLVYENPATGQLEIPEDYLSGNVRKKLQQAKQAADVDGSFYRNVFDLQEVVPQDIPAHAANFRMGVGYIPADIYQEFVEQLTGVRSRIKYIPSSGRWALEATGNIRDSRNTTTYAVGKVTGFEIVDDIMNNKATTISNKTKTGTVVDEAATAEAEEMQKNIMDQFSDWVRNHDVHSKTLETNYNDAMNSLVERKQRLPYFEHFPGAATEVDGKPFKLRLHQIRAVMRSITQNTLLAHGVGTGKTYTLITAAMEMRRLGTARKPMIVVKNSTLGAFSASFMKLYPSARILVPSANEMTAKGRKRFFGRISTGDWDAVIIPQSQLDLMPDDPTRVEGYLQERIAELQSVIDNLTGNEPDYFVKDLERDLGKLYSDVDDLYNDDLVLDDEGNPIFDEEKGDFKRYTKKEQEARDKARDEAESEQFKGKKKKVKDEGRASARAKARVDAQARRRVDKVQYFDSFGVDALMVDESHAYKKLGFQTAITGVRGIDVGRSQKSLGVLMKTRSVMDRTGGKNVIFSTGTPITNTMAEAWTNLRYLAPNMLKEMGIQYFDQFRNTFAAVKPSLEKNAGGKMVVVNRLAKFYNLPELLRAFRSVADVVTTDDIPEFKADPDLAPPKMANQSEEFPEGRPTMVFAEISQPVASLIRTLSQRYKTWKKMRPKDKRANRVWPMMLVDIGKQAAIDIRLVDPTAPDDPGSKVNTMVASALENYKTYDQYKATQMIFSDNIESGQTPLTLGLAGAPGAAYTAPTFNLYQDIKKKLIAGGVPESEIAIVNDKKYAKPEAVEKLADQMNDGTIRFMIGSSEKMGVGVNAQERMIALHHLDAPKRPDLWTQRNGRILRQGNIFAKLNIPIDIRAYGIKGTRDSTIYGRLRFKEKFINQLLKSSYTDMRETPDDEDDDVNADDFFAEFEAALSGSKAEQRMVIVQSKLRQERNRQKQYATRMKDTLNRLRNKQEGIEEVERNIKEDEWLEKKRNEVFPDNDIKTVKIEDGEVLTEKFYDPITKALEAARIKLIPTIEQLAQMSYDEKRNMPTKTQVNFEINGMIASVEISLPLYSATSNEEANYKVRLIVPTLKIRRDMGNDSAQSMISTLRNALREFEGLGERTKRVYSNTLRDIENLNKDLKKTFDSGPLQALENELATLQAIILEESRQEDLLEDSGGSAETNFDDSDDEFFRRHTGRDQEEDGDAVPETEDGNPDEDLGDSGKSPTGTGIPRALLEDMPDEFDSSWDTDDIDEEIERTKNTPDENLTGFGPASLIMSLPRYTKLAYLYLRKGIKTVGQFAQALGQRISSSMVTGFNRAKWWLKKRLGFKGPVFAAVSPGGGPASGSTSGSGTGAGSTGTGATGATGTTGTGSLRSRLAKMRKDARDNAERMWQEYGKRFYGESDLNEKTAGTKGATNAWNFINALEDATARKLSKKAGRGIRKLIERGMNSRDKKLSGLNRMAANTVNSIFQGLGKTDEDQMRSENFAGETRVRSIADAINIQKILRKILKDDPASLARINQVVDPEFYTERTADEWEVLLRAELGDDEVDGMSAKRIADTYDDYRQRFGFDEPGYKMHTVADLSAEERSVYEHVRFLYDMMHEINFSIGKLTADTYEKNKGNYSARLYDEYEIPEEVEESLKLGGALSIDQTLYMKRGELTAWKLMNGISDPIYSVSKRLAQTMSNKAVVDYAEYILKHKKGATAKEETPGYRKMGYGYGPLAGKWLRNDIAEDFVGHFFSQAWMNKFYDVLKTYDKWDYRQYTKKMLTVGQPAVHIGNIMGNNVFAWMAGVQFLRLNSNLIWASEQKDAYSAMYRYMLSQGILGTDAINSDLMPTIDPLTGKPVKRKRKKKRKGGAGPATGGTTSTGPVGPPPAAYGITGASVVAGYNQVKAAIDVVAEPVMNFYQGVDDYYKMAAFKSLTDLGYSPKEAADRVKQAFQNYRRVGKLYSVFSKVPFVGPAFGTFAGDLTRILRTGLTERPLHTAATIALLKMISYLLAKHNGESDDDRRLRESRAGAPLIPMFDLLGGDIPLEWKIGDDTYNVARIVSPAFLYSSGSGDDSWGFLNKLSPLPVEVPDWTKNPGGIYAVGAAQNINDPVFAPMLQMLLNSDFRGVPIADPDQTKYDEESTLTSTERNFNRLRYLFRGYAPYGATINDFYNAIMGDKDYYGRQKSVGQVAMSFFGVKTAGFPDTKYSDIMEYKMNGFGIKFRDQSEVIRKLKKQFDDEKITQDQYDRRLEEPTQSMVEITEAAEKEFYKLTGEYGNLDLTKDNVVEGTNKSRARSGGSSNGNGGMQKLRSLPKMRSLPR